MSSPRLRDSQFIDLCVTPLISQNDLNVIEQPSFYLAVILLISILHMRRLPRITQLESAGDQDSSVEHEFHHTIPSAAQ